MRKPFMVFVFLFLALGHRHALSCPIEGPNMPNGASPKTGVQINVMTDVDTKNVKGELRSRQIFLTLSYGITKWLCFDGKVGVGELTFDQERAIKMEYDADFAGGYGGRILLWDDKKSGINCILGLHHISVHPEDVEVSGIRYKAILDEWQGSVLVSKKIRNLRPYIAGKFSKIYLIRKIGEERERITPEHDWGFVAGADLDINDNARFNIEGRLFDETALTFGFNYAF